MNQKDREDVLLIVEAVLDNYLAEPLAKDILSEIEQSIMDNWHILKPIRTTCISCAAPILMIKSGAKTRRAEVRKETFVFDSQSETRFITEAGDVIHGTAVHPDGECKFDLLAGYRLHVCKKGE